MTPPIAVRVRQHRTGRLPLLLYEGLTMLWALCQPEVCEEGFVDMSALGGLCNSSAGDYGHQVIDGASDRGMMT